MSVWLLTFQQSSDPGLLSRLKALGDIQGLEADKALDCLRPGDISLCTGNDIKLLGFELATRILQSRVNLVVLSPFPDVQSLRILPDVDEIRLRAVDFSPASVVDVKFESACELNELVILYNQVFTVYPGVAIVTTTKGFPVVVRYQHRSTWGNIVFVTLLLGSASARSLRSHRVAFMTALTKWLVGVQENKPEILHLAGFDQNIRETRIYPILILLLSFVGVDRPVSSEQFGETFTIIQKRLDKSFSEISWNSDWLAELEKTGCLEKTADSEWQVKPDGLTLEIARLHLSAYVRRLL